MKSSYLSLTFLIAFLPTLIPTFNILNVGGKNETLTLTHQCTSSTCHHSDHHACPFGAPYSGDFQSSEQLAFGAELGKYIREHQIKDANYRIKTVVIDPGHGGKDPGCSGKGTREKEIALSIGLQLGRSLQRSFPNINFIFTRQSDVFIPLDDRAKIANENNADLFISIHCNNFPHSSTPKGSETYVLGLHRAKDNLEVAKRENSAIFYEDNYEETYGGYDPNSAEGHIILSMYQNAFLEQSILFANKIEKNIKQNTQHRSRGVRQAGFLVLRKTTMPSVLVETGYLSNATDNRFLSTQNGKSQIVNSIAQAFVEYKKEVENGATAMAPDVYASTVQHQRRNNPPAIVKQVPVQQPKKITRTPSRQTAKSGNNRLSKQSLIIPTKKTTTTAKSVVPSRAVSIEYKVLLAATTQLIDTDTKPWTKVPYKVQVVKDGNNFRYMAIDFVNFEAAVTAKSELRKIGFKEAFLVAYQNGKRIDMKKAMAKTGVK